MAWNGSGVFLINSAGQPVVDDTLITAPVFNALTADVATGLSNTLTKDGQQTATANLPMGGFKVTGVGAATSRTDAASLATIQDGTGIYVATVGGTADAITLTPIPPIALYVAGQTFMFLATGTNTGAVTVAISSLTAKAVTKSGTTALAVGDIPSGALVTLTYDGTQFQMGTIFANVSPFIQTVLDDTTAVAARTTLGALSDAAGAVTTTNILDGTIATTDLNDSVINDMTTVAPATGDYLALADVSDSNKKKKATELSVLQLGLAGTLTAGVPIVVAPIVQNVITPIAHGLAAIPIFVTATLECTTGEHGWSVGDKITLPSSWSSAPSGSSGYTIGVDITYTTLYMTNTTVLGILNKSTLANANITLASWKLTVTPYRLN